MFVDKIALANDLIPASKQHAQMRDYPYGFALMSRYTSNPRILHDSVYSPIEHNWLSWNGSHSSGSALQ